MIGLDNSILYTALPALNVQLETTALQSLWIINAYPLVLSGLLLGTGTLGDKLGHRLMWMIGLCIFGAASLAAAFAPSAWALVAARGLLGVGAAVMMPATLALIRLTFPDEQERNTAIGIWASVAVVGSALGPLVGGALLAKFWWGSIFLINVPLVVAALIATVLLAPENVPNPQKRWDVVSSVYALFALSGLTMTIKQVANPNRTVAVLVAAACISAVAAVLFARRQQRLDDPLLTLDIFRSRLFAGGVVAAAGAMFVVAGVELMTSQQLQLVEGFTPLHSGAVLTAMAVAAIPASVLGGANLHRVGFLPLIAGGFLGAALGTALLVPGTAADGLALELAGLALIGVSAGSVMSVSSIAILGAAPAHRSGMAAGVEEVSYELGTLITVAITGSLVPRWLVRGLPPELKERGMSALYDAPPHPLAATAYTDAYHAILLLLAAAALLFAAFTAWCFWGNPKSGELGASISTGPSVH